MSRFDWDPAKADANLRKHGIAFEDAAEMLEGALAIERPDIAHSIGETRFRTVGYTSAGHLIVVITSIDGPRPRIISARRATKRERHDHVG